MLLSLPEGMIDMRKADLEYIRILNNIIDGRLLRIAELKSKAYPGAIAYDDSGKPVGAMKVVLRGFCGLYPYLSLIGVHADCRGMGVGKFLMDQLERMTRDSGAKRVTLMVSDFNDGAQRFYKRLGYYELGRLPDAAKEGITELLMVKDLA